MASLRTVFRGSLAVVGLLVLLVLTTNAPGYCPATQADTPERDIGSAPEAALPQAEGAGRPMFPWQWEFAADAQQDVPGEAVLLR